MKKEIKEMIDKALVVSVDMDKTLCKEECWNEEQCMTATPITEVINAVNELSKNKYIVIYTARKDFLMPATLKWLRKYGIAFNAISNTKTPTDVYIDDKAIRPEEIL